MNFSIIIRILLELVKTRAMCELYFVIFEQYVLIICKTKLHQLVIMYLIIILIKTSKYFLFLLNN